MKSSLMKEVLPRGLVRKGLLLLPPPVALEFVRECSRRGIELIGYDAFRLLPGERIQPIMDDSLDLTIEPYADCGQVRGIALAEYLISERLTKDIFFEMFTEEDSTI
jgi:hypothetical protein